MWCAKCQADVAAEVSADHRQVRCANCGTLISAPNAAPTTDSARHARDLLARWSSGPLNADGGAAPVARPASAPMSAAPPVPAAAAAPASAAASAPVPPLASRTTRVDTLHDPHLHDRHTGYERPAATAQYAAAAEEPIPQEPPPMAEPLDVRAALEFGPPATNMQAFWGQMLAYGGVLALTVGAAMLLAGYFGSAEWQDYTPTGWLVSTTGQMLLFLGVITLVSGGMEQTTQEVTRRVDALGERIVRIEYATRSIQSSSAVRSAAPAIGAKR